MSFVQDKVGVAPAVRNVLDGGSQEPQGVFAVRGTVTSADDGVAVDIGTVPADADVVGITVDVTTAFDDGTSNLLDVGKSGAITHFHTDVDVSATGQTLTGWTNGGDVGGSDILVQAQYDAGGGAATAGSADVIVFFVPSG